MREFDPRAITLLPTASEHGDLRYLDLIALMLIGRLLAERLSEDQTRLACRTLLDRFDELDDAGAGMSLIVGAHDGATLCALYTGACLFDSDMTVLATVNLSKLIEDLNLALRDAEA